MLKADGKEIKTSKGLKTQEKRAIGQEKSERQPDPELG